MYKRQSNYRVLSIATLLLFPAYYFIFDLLIDMDTRYVNPELIGLGRSLNTSPLVPMTFVVLGTLFLRSSLIIVFIGFFTVMFGW